MNETYPNIVYYGVGLDAGVLAIRLNAFMNNTGTRDRVYVNATILPERLIEYDAQGQPTSNQIVFRDTSTGWGPIGTGILSLQNTTLLPPDLLTQNATIISVLWTGPQQTSAQRNVTAQFNIFIAPAIEAMGRMIMGDDSKAFNDKNATGLITAVTVANFPFATSGGSLALRNIVRINETVYSVDETVRVDISKTVRFLTVENTTISTEVTVDRNILNLVRNFSRTQYDRVVVVGAESVNGTGRVVLEGLAVDLEQVEAALPKANNAGTEMACSRLLIGLSTLIATLCLLTT
jgi:hypothetical protein